MSPDQSAALKLVTALAEDRADAERRFELAIAAARAAGEPVGEIAAAASLSSSRVNAILKQQRGGAFRELPPDEIGYLLENAFTVGIVPAGRLALTDYEKYEAYICQPHRSFRKEMNHLGFYARAEVSPYFPAIRKTWEEVDFSHGEVERLRASGDSDDAELADIIERVLAAPDRGGHRPGAHKVLLLAPPNHADTVKLAHPIKHLDRRRGQAFVRKQRYTTLAALNRAPATTAELLRFEGT
jgi:hypothetical protein